MTHTSKEKQTVKRPSKKSVKKATKKTGRAAAERATKTTPKAHPKSRPKNGDVLVELGRLPEVLKPAEVQQVLRISRSSFFRMIDAGTMPGAVRIHGSWRVLRDRLRQYLIDEST